MPVLAHEGSLERLLKNSDVLNELFRLCLPADSSPTVDQLRRVESRVSLLFVELHLEEDVDHLLLAPLRLLLLGHLPLQVPSPLLLVHLGQLGGLAFAALGPIPSTLLLWPHGSLFGSRVVEYTSDVVKQHPTLQVAIKIIPLEH